jgi:hypothetical protein
MIQYRRGLLVAAAGTAAFFLLRSPSRGPQLISVQTLSDYGDVCPPVESTAYASSQEGGQTGDVTRGPTRTIRDTYPIYTAVAVDTNFDEVVLMDTNSWGLRIYNRLDNTPAGAGFTPPKRVIEGPETDIQFNNGLYIDPKNGDIYSVETDTGDKVVVFPRDANGNVKPARILATPHRGFSLAVDEERQELYVGVQYPP